MRWFNPFSGKVQNGLEGNTFYVGNVKITVRNVIAEGGFLSIWQVMQFMCQINMH
jgi:hypothetical protein